MLFSTFILKENIYVFITFVSVIIHDSYFTVSYYLNTPGVSEWFGLTAFLRTVDIEVHIVYISRVIIAYTLESLSSLT